MLIFVYDNLLNPVERTKLKLPLHFISFAYIDAGLYIMRSKTKAIKHWNVYYGATLDTKGLSRTKVFGAIYLLEEDFFNLRHFDSFYGCSLSSIGGNNTHDLYHRKTVEARLIEPTHIRDVREENYWVQSTHQVEAYIANSEHPAFANRIRNRQYKVPDRCATKAYMSQYEVISEELHEDTSEDLKK